MGNQIPKSHAGMHCCAMGVWAGLGLPKLSLPPGIVRWIVLVFSRAGVTTAMFSDHLDKSPLVSAHLEKEITRNGHQVCLGQATCHSRLLAAQGLR